MSVGTPARCPQLTSLPPTARGARSRDPEPSEPHGPGPRVKTCSSSCLSWLHPLRSWSLRQTRGGSYRAKATEYGELVKTSISPEESREFQKLERRFASLADNEQVLADDHNSAVHVSNRDQSRGAALAVEEEYVLRCLGAVLIMQWNTLPTTLQREVFDTAGSVGKLLETAALRGQIARFLHKHKNDYGCNKLTPTEDTHSDARLDAAPLSRWDDEGGAVRDGLPM